MGKNILLLILCSSKDIERIEVLKNRAIKSNDGHNLVFKFLADGDRPKDIPKEWEWLMIEDKVGNRFVKALTTGLVKECYDYVFFTDNDTIIDIDLFVKIADKNSNIPTIWTSYPGMMATTHIKDIIKRHATDIVGNIDYKDIWIGFSTSVINRKFIIDANKHKGIYEKLMLISKDINPLPPFFIGDLQISILGFMINAQHIKGDLSGASCWPSFLSSSVFLKNSNKKLWHIHGTLYVKLFPYKNIIKCLKKSPYKNRKELLMDLAPSLTSGIDVNKCKNLSFDLIILLAPWNTGHNGADIRSPKIDIANMIPEYSNCKLIAGANGEYTCYGIPFCQKAKIVKNRLVFDVNGHHNAIFECSLNGYPVGYDSDHKDNCGLLRLIRFK